MSIVIVDYTQQLFPDKTTMFSKRKSRYGPTHKHNRWKLIINA